MNNLALNELSNILGLTRTTPVNIFRPNFGLSNFQN